MHFLNFFINLFTFVIMLCQLKTFISIFSKIIFTSLFFFCIHLRNQLIPWLNFVLFQLFIKRFLIFQRRNIFQTIYFTNGRKLEIIILCFLNIIILWELISKMETNFILHFLIILILISLIFIWWITLILQVFISQTQKLVKFFTLIWIFDINCFTHYISFIALNNQIQFIFNF